MDELLKNESVKAFIDKCVIDFSKAYPEYEFAGYDAPQYLDGCYLSLTSICCKFSDTFARKNGLKSESVRRVIINELSNKITSYIRNYETNKNKYKADKKTDELTEYLVTTLPVYKGKLIRIKVNEGLMFIEIYFSNFEHRLRFLTKNKEFQCISGFLDKVDKFVYKNENGKKWLIENGFDFIKYEH